jgi:fibronectin type 3 domain-containing protein
MTLNVQFDPGALGSFTGQLTIVSSASTATLALNGTGDPHEVALNWTCPPSSSDPAVGFNVYRAPSGTTSYQRVNPSVETLMAYTDSVSESGVTYDYVVRSVDSAGLESASSNITTVAIP